MHINLHGNQLLKALGHNHNYQLHYNNIMCSAYAWGKYQKILHTRSQKSFLLFNGIFNWVTYIVVYYYRGNTSVIKLWYGSQSFLCVIRSISNYYPKSLLPFLYIIFKVIILRPFFTLMDFLLFYIVSLPILWYKFLSSILGPPNFSLWFVFQFINIDIIIIFLSLRHFLRSSSRWSS